MSTQRQRAFEIAHRRPQGGRWVVWTGSSPRLDYWDESAVMDYRTAVQYVRERRAQYATYIRSGDPQDYDLPWDREGGTRRH